MTQDLRRTEVLIVGGGLAGTAAALMLARAGRHVTLVERDSRPRDKVCGEFLSAEALDMLLHLGVQPEGLGAPDIHTVRLCAGDRVAASALPFRARSLTRRCLDDHMLSQAAVAGVDVVRGLTVEALEPSPTGAGWYARLSDGTTLQAPKALLATGKHDLRGFARPPGRQGGLVALKMYWRLAPGQAAALGGHVELLLHPAGYTGLQMVEGAAANLCALVQQSHLARVGGWPGLLAELCRTNAHAAERLGGAHALLPKPLAISSIPYGFVRRHALATDLWAVGDQAAVIPSFTGDGMSIALYTGIQAAEAVLEGRSAQSFQHRLYDTLRGQVAHATVLSRAMVGRLSQPLLAAAAHLLPSTITWAARTTRMPGSLHSSGTARRM